MAKVKRKRGWFGRRSCQNSQLRRGWNPTPSRRQKLGVALLWKPLQHQIQCQTPNGKTMEQTLALAQTDLDPILLWLCDLGQAESPCWFSAAVSLKWRWPHGTEPRQGIVKVLSNIEGLENKRTWKKDLKDLRVTPTHNIFFQAIAFGFKHLFIK